MPLLAKNKTYGTNFFEGESNRSNAYLSWTHLSWPSHYILWEQQVKRIQQKYSPSLWLAIEQAILSPRFDWTFRPCWFLISSCYLIARPFLIKIICFKTMYQYTCLRQLFEFWFTFESKIFYFKQSAFRSESDNIWFGFIPKGTA